MAQETNTEVIASSIPFKVLESMLLHLKTEEVKNSAKMRKAGYREVLVGLSGD